MSQQDGWVQIALDETSAYVATEFVDVRYALNEAIEFTPVEETRSLRPRRRAAREALEARAAVTVVLAARKHLQAAPQACADRKTTRLSSWESVCMGRYQLDKWYGLFWIYDVGYGTLRRRPAASFGFPGGAGRSISSSQMRQVI